MYRYVFCVDVSFSLQYALVEHPSGGVHQNRGVSGDGHSTRTVQLRDASRRGRLHHTSGSVGVVNRAMNTASIGAVRVVVTSSPMRMVDEASSVVGVTSLKTHHRLMGVVEVSGGVVVVAVRHHHRWLHHTAVVMVVGTTVCDGIG